MSDLQPSVDQLPPPTASPATPSAPDSSRSFTAAWLLSLLLGYFGVDRFYLGKVGTGILKLITFGGAGIWWLIDLILILTGAMRDKQGAKLASTPKARRVAWIVTGAVIVLSLVLSRTSGGGVPAGTAGDLNAANNNAPAPAASKAAPVQTVQSWADSTYGRFTPVTKTGKSDSLITLPTGAKAGLITASYHGTGNFSIATLDSSNQSTGDLLVNSLGSYSGTTAYGFSALSQGVSLQVSSDAPWTITIAPLSTAPLLATTGSGDAVYLYSGGVGQLTATHAGSSNFSVSEETDDPTNIGLLINTIGTYSGTVPMTAGPAVITVTGDGKWTMSTK